MSMTAFDHGTPWTEDEYLALGETSDRVELLDGSLLVTPGPSVAHQRISIRLAKLLIPAAEAAGLEVLESINLRLQPNRIPIPDLVISRPADDGLTVDPKAVHLVCEITSPRNAAVDRILKMQYYADAGIPWYLLVDPEPLTLRLFRLDGDKYTTHAEAVPGVPLSVTDPVEVTIDPATLVRRPSGRS